MYFRGPLVPYLYALVYRLGGGLLSALFVNQLAGAATCALVCLLARAYFSRAVAWLAAGVAAFYWPFVYFDGELLTEPVYITLVVLALWRSSAPRRAPKLARLGVRGGVPRSRGARAPDRARAASGAAVPVCAARSREQGPGSVPRRGCARR